MRRLRRAALVALTACGCQKEPAPAPAPAAAPSSAPPVASAAPTGAGPAAAAPSAWFTGKWAGRYEASLSRIELAVGGVKEWKQDDGARASGPGTLELQAAPDGTVTGSAQGPLGAQRVRGRFEGEQATLELVPEDDQSLRGIVLASRDGEGVRGTAQASSGDSLTVRTATVTLTRAP